MSGKMSAGLYLLTIFALLTAPSLAMEPIDKIVALVGSEPIMASEVAAQLQMMAIQGNLNPETQEELEQLQNEVLERMISERLFLIEAFKDTMVKVSDAEIDQALDDHIAQTAMQFESEEQFLEQLAYEGLNLRSYKKRLRPEMKNQLYKQRLISFKLSTISISQQEVSDFYNQFRDSIPEQPEAIRIAHILITFQPSGGTEDSVKSMAERIRKMAAEGADFASLAINHSSGPSAVTGGDLGFITREDVVEEFGRAAFNLQPGDISGVVRSPLGFHIIKCEEVDGSRSHLRHILFEVTPTAFDSTLSYGLIDSLLNEINGGNDFKELAKVYSADDESRKQGGELGWLAVENLPPSFIVALDSIKEIGDVFGPVQSEFGLHIIKKLDWQEGRSLSLETDFDQIKEMARQSKTGELVDNWLKEIREKTFVEIRL